MSLRADVDRGLEIRAEIAKLEAELKDIETRVKHTALHGDHVELADADREGKQYLASGSARIVPVIFTSDMIVGEFGHGGPKHLLIADAVNGDDVKISAHFKLVRKFENRFDSGKKFRASAAELLGEKAPQFITACLARDKDGIPKSAIKIMWDEAKQK